jgi:hypothetical protein
MHPSVSSFGSGESDMDKPQLQALLESLHHELASLDEVDDRTKELLAQVTDDVNRVLERDDETAAEDVATSQQNVRSAISEFEAEHPRLAETLGRLADGLANLGI